VSILAKPFGQLLYSREHAPGEAAKKVESHAPSIEAPDEVKANQPFQVRVKVGPHPNTREHSIRWIELYVYEEGRSFNPIYVSHIDLEPEYAEPEVVVTLRLRKTSTIYVLGYCNLHGVWEARKQVRVVS
jgi:superoxide reductase